MSALKLAAICLAVLALSSCSARGQPSQERRTSSHEVLLLPTDDSLHLYRRDDGRLADTLRVVLRDSASWEEMWSRLWGGEGPRAAPEVDFGRSMLIVASLGDQPYPTKWVNIDSVFVESGTLAVVVRVTQMHRPQCGGVPTRGARPADVVVVRRTEDRVRFIERADTALDCGHSTRRYRP